MDKQNFFETLQQARKLSELTLKAMEKKELEKLYGLYYERVYYFLKKEKSEADGFEEVFGEFVGAFEDAGLSLKTMLAKIDKLCVLTLCVILKDLEDEYGAYLGRDIEEGKEKTDGRI